MSLLGTLGFVLRHPFNRGHAVEALARYARWQVGSRLVGVPVPVPFANDMLLWATPGMAAATGNIYCGLHEFEDMAFAAHMLRPGDWFADVGANIGSYTILAASVGASVISFEPSPEASRWLLANVRLNRLEDRVEVVQAAIGAATGGVLLSSGHDSTNHVVDEDSPGGVRVAMKTLDIACRGRCPALVKMDVEGYEAAVIEGAARLLADPGLFAMIVELNGSGTRYGFDETALVRRVLGAGFRCYRYDPFARRLVPMEGGCAVGSNQLFVRNLTAISERLANAAPIRVSGRAI